MEKQIELNRAVNRFIRDWYLTGMNDSIEREFGSEGEEINKDIAKMWNLLSEVNDGQFWFMDRWHSDKKEFFSLPEAIKEAKKQAGEVNIYQGREVVWTATGKGVVQ